MAPQALQPFHRETTKQRETSEPCESGREAVFQTCADTPTCSSQAHKTEDGGLWMYVVFLKLSFMVLRLFYRLFKRKAA